MEVWKFLLVNFCIEYAFLEQVMMETGKLNLKFAETENVLLELKNHVHLSGRYKFLQRVRSPLRSIRFFNLSMSVCDEQFFVRIYIYHSDERDSSIIWELLVG